MPTYEYECQNCGFKFEEFQGMNDEPLKKCPKCGKNKLQRLLGVGMGIIFKGSGFYETDYKRKSSKDSTESKGSDTNSSSGSKDTSKGSVGE